jgi:spoIIIJ-associated protein
VPAPDAEGDEVDLEGDGPTWLEGLFERMELDVEAEFADETDERVLVNLTGEDADRLLGRGKMGPKALEAVETILSRVFAGHSRSNDIYLDVDGARKARTERLENVAEDLADRAIELSKKVTMSGLNSSERRVIHHRLREDDRVDTESVGEGIFRRLRIEPHN